MNQPKLINISNNKPFFNLVFILVDSSQLGDFHESTQQKSSDWKIETYDDHYLLIGNNPIILLKAFNMFSLNFNVKIKLLTPIYAEIPTHVSGIQSQIFSKITLDNDYQLSCLGTKVSIRCTQLSAKTLSLVEKLPFEKTSEPLGVRYKKFDSFHFDLSRLKKEAESLNLPTSGTKDKLISRLHKRLEPDMRYDQEINLIYDSLREQGLNISNYVSGIFKYKSNIFIINTDQMSLDEFPLGQAKYIYKSIYTALEHFSQIGPISENGVYHSAFLLNTFTASKHYQFLGPGTLVPLFKTSMEVSMRCAGPRLCVPYFRLGTHELNLSGPELCQLILNNYQNYQEDSCHFSHWEILDFDPFNLETESGTLVKNLLKSRNIKFPKNLKQLLESLNNYKFKDIDKPYKGICIH